MAKTFVSHPNFRCTFIHRSGGTCTNPKDSHMEGYLLIKRVIFSMAYLLPYILMPFGSSISKHVLADRIVMPSRSWNKKRDVSRVDVASWSTEVVKQFSKETSMMQPSLWYLRIWIKCLASFQTRIFELV